MNMQYLTYNNLNSLFTFNNIWSLFTKFWINEVINKRYSKIWLTIKLINSNNKSFTLINNLPFSTNGYTDILIVLRQVFDTSIYDRNILSSIIFKYHFEYKDDYKKYINITNIYIYIISTLIILILILCMSLLLFDVYQIYNIEYINKELFNSVTENIKYSHSREYNEIYTKRFIFSPFIELFNGNYTSFPSKFVDINSTELNELKCLLNNENITLNNETNSYIKDLLNYNIRIKEYESLVSDLVYIVSSKP